MAQTIQATAPIAEKVDDTRFRITQTRTTTNVENAGKHCGATGRADCRTAKIENRGAGQS